MKKLLSTILALVLSVSMLAGSLTASAKNITVTLNGNPIYFDQPPVIRNDRTLVPIRAIFEAMGLFVHWDPEKQSILAGDDYTIITMQVGTYGISYGNNDTGAQVAFMDVAPCIINDRTYVPVRYVAEATGYNVEWDAASQTIRITGSKNTAAPAPQYTNTNGYALYADSPDVVDFGKLNNIACTGFNEDYQTYTYSYTCEAQAVADYMNAIETLGYEIQPDSGEFWGIMIINYMRQKSVINITYDKGTKECLIIFTKP